jgi:hypothetical protein
MASFASSTATCPPLVVGRSPWWASSAVALLRGRIVGQGVGGFRVGVNGPASRDETGDAFAAGIIFHTGPHLFPVNDRIIAAPVSALWS